MPDCGLPSRLLVILRTDQLAAAASACSYLLLWVFETPQANEYENANKWAYLKTKAHKSHLRELDNSDPRQCGPNPKHFGTGLVGPICPDTRALVARYPKDSSNLQVSE